MAHKEILGTKLRRVIRTGLYNFWRNGTVSMASVLVMMVTLMVIALVSFSGALLETSLAELRNKIDINVNFISDATEEEILSIKQSLESLPEVLLVTYVTREEALENFKQRHANDPTILAALDEVGYNPLGAILNIKARDPSQYASVTEFLEGADALTPGEVNIVDSVNYYENKPAIDRLTKIISAADRLGFALTIFLVVISILISFNTIRLTIYIAKDEISVMRLVGASTAYIQGPFIVVGIIYGIVATLLTLILLMPLTYWLGTVTQSFFDNFNIFSYFLRHFLELGLIMLISGVLVGALSSTLAIRKYLRV